MTDQGTVVSGKRGVSLKSPIRMILKKFRFPLPPTCFFTIKVVLVSYFSFRRDRFPLPEPFAIHAHRRGFGYFSEATWLATIHWCKDSKQKFLGREDQQPVQA
jgi:hypothetical protein